MFTNPKNHEKVVSPINLSILVFFQNGHHWPSWILACKEKNYQIWKFYQKYFESYNHVRKENTKLYSKKEKNMDLSPSRMSACVYSLLL